MSALSNRIPKRLRPAGNDGPDRTGRCRSALSPRPARGAADEAQSFADELNDRTSEGVVLSLRAEEQRLARRAIGPATDVEYEDGRWVVDVRWPDIEDSVAALYPDVVDVGGEASFSVIPPPDIDAVDLVDGEAPTAQVLVVPGEPARECCAPISALQIERVLRGETESARLLMKTVDGERGVGWAEGLEITELVGSFTTRYTPGRTG